jgi:protein SCO1
VSRNEPPPGRRRRLLRWLLAACVVLPVALQAADDPSRAKFGLDQQSALEFSRSTIGHVPDDYVLRDRQGREVSLHSYRGKPLLVNFIYTSCFQICPNGSRSLFAAVRAMRERFGADQFNVVSIGFNQPEDSPQALAVFATQQRIHDRNWEFLSPRAEDVAALAADFGFQFAATPAGFDHTLQVTILDRDGRVYRQVYGDGFAADSLGEPIKQLIAGTLVSDAGSWSDLIDRVRILCSVYDPLTGTYRTDYKLYIEIAGGFTFALAGLLFAIGEWRNRRRMRRVSAAPAR